MKTRSAVAAILFACLPANAGESQSVAEFTSEEFEKIDWSIVDDGVMGGLSQGKREISKDGILRFFGTLSLENRLFVEFYGARESLPQKKRILVR